MDLELQLQQQISRGIETLFGFTPSPEMVQLQQTRKEFEGDLTLVVFPMVRMTRKSPAETASALGNFLTSHSGDVEKFNVVNGFLNLSLRGKIWIDLLQEAFTGDHFGTIPEPDNPELVMIEYSSPNTNKPLHLGHIRNNLLGFSLAEILKGNGKKVVKTNIVNDRGIHICKSMYAWQRWGEGKTPANTGIKGDHLVGDFYVLFDKHYKIEID